MHIGQSMYKTEGYAFHGEIRGIIETREGHTRLICQHDDGWLFVFNPEQVVLVEVESEDPHREKLTVPDVENYKATRYDGLRLSDKAGGGIHPLSGVPQAALDAAAQALRDGDAYAGIDGDEIAPVAEAVLLAGLSVMAGAIADDEPTASREQLDQLPYLDVHGKNRIYLLPNGRVKWLERVLDDAYELAARRARPSSTESAVTDLATTLTKIRRAIGPAIGREADEELDEDDGDHIDRRLATEIEAHEPLKPLGHCAEMDEGYTNHYCKLGRGHLSEHKCRCGHEWVSG